MKILILGSGSFAGQAVFYHFLSKNIDVVGINLEYASWNEDISMTTIDFLLQEIFKIGSPILPPIFTLKLFFLRISKINLQVVDFPFVPVTAIVIVLGLKI